ncbi:Carboxy-cis,cis-muconate cyclase [Madurella mycetomatis]|uniref:Carboxy-cis,cis-muconate cyclase n=1 Tax=Madurella mycetomatis TaxID=100816 RepID=A0A175WEP8_9PEZI|nr:Carboxy-cis,cis-muconate cyclase [Madurella mycetomatis]
MALSVDDNGTLTGVVDWTYANQSWIHGLALGERDGKQFVYTADLGADIIWTHEVDRATSSVSEVDRFPAPYPEMHPRHLIDADTTLHWSSGVMLSPSARYLWATARALNSSETGFISVFLLGDDGHIPFGVTGTRPDYNDEGHGYVQIWKMDGQRDAREGTEYATAPPVAKVDIPDGGCCANAIWYS